jgi:hypothetical protein
LLVSVASSVPTHLALIGTERVDTTTHLTVPDEVEGDPPRDLAAEARAELGRQ